MQTVDFDTIRSLFEPLSTKQGLMWVRGNDRSLQQPLLEFAYLLACVMLILAIRDQELFFLDALCTVVVIAM